MLQQTRVATTLAYYPRFLQAFPDVRTLAEAPLGDVLAAWAGLGYYRRARALHAAAREVVTRYGGVLPRSSAELRTLPGVGGYTAGAVSSIAFGERAPAVDGNVTRVLVRVLGLEGPAAAPETRRAVAAAAADLVPERGPGDHNQAMMELGATVCTPTSPACAVCPVSKLCVARAEGRQAELPAPSQKRATPTVRMTAALARRGERAVLGRRPAEGLFGGLWEPPMAAGWGPRPRAALELSGLSLGSRLGRVRHVLTHRVLDVTVVEALARRSLRAIEPYESVEWAALDRSRGLSTLARKIVALGVEAP